MYRSTLAAFAIAAATSASANEFAPAMESFMSTEIMNWANDAVIVSAIMDQNARYAGLAQADIDAMDQAWRAEVGMANAPTITPVLMNSASDFLRQHVAASGGMITEVFIMDNHGLNVAASDVTSDMWQGDEAKFSKTYPMGAGAFHLSDVDFDESTQTYQGQISMTIVDPASGAPIGAITVGVNADALL
ncbi:hypothetical protein AIOL_004590 [Candidatus Rhodobacter oscarellae]|uniref:Uncharacterized protein n=1 Tax=Candidatus Rhodobacter oscarellae TaxID=1675527 RepID=A0A0J9H1L3_9RHOB|nr:hypothetical protein [Candidatus Rhodobacter lobularis]KMW59608.1 hypothetical protein AIOL_004590 [Candidatus Rhodobacter lobularis]